MNIKTKHSKDNMEYPKLSICIATYNRANYIGETLESIIPQLTAEVEIVIVDGASTDNTQVVVQSYQKKSTAIKYFRLPEKGGVDQDYCRAVDYAQADYCWLFPDDDLFIPGAIAVVLDHIRSGYSLMILNARSMTPDLSEVLIPKMLDIEVDEVIESADLDSLFVCAVSFMSFIGCVVVNRSLWMNRNKEMYWGSEFVHVGVVFQALLPGPALLVAEPQIMIRYGNAQWTSRAFSIWMIKWPRLLWSFQMISDRAKQLVMPREPWLNLKEILYYRAIGAFDYKAFVAISRQNASPWWWKLGALSIAVLPGKIVNTASRLLFFIVRKNSNKMVAYDLAHSRYSFLKENQ
jgi:abequosyltransferase